MTGTRRGLSHNFTLADCEQTGTYPESRLPPMLTVIPTQAADIRTIEILLKCTTSYTFRRFTKAPFFNGFLHGPLKFTRKTGHLFGFRYPESQKWAFSRSWSGPCRPRHLDPSTMATRSQILPADPAVSLTSKRRGRG